MDDETREYIDGQIQIMRSMQEMELQDIYGRLQELETAAERIDILDGAVNTLNAELMTIPAFRSASEEEPPALDDAA